MTESTMQETTGLFSNGMQFLFPRTEDGPSIYAVMEGAWMFAALIKGIRQKVWESNPTEANPVATCWARLGLIEVEDRGIDLNREQEGPQVYLTGAGKRVIDCQALLEYEFSMMQQQLDGAFETDPAKYVALRGGLENYSVAFLPDMHQWVAEQGKLSVPNPLKFFDYCGGNGGYLASFLAANPTAQGLLYDREPGLTKASGAVLARMGIKAGDAFKDDQFFANHAGAYDVVLLSEILHCKGPAERQFLLQRAKSLLKLSGVLLVIEQYPNLRLEWRMHDMTEAGQCISEQMVAAEAQDAGFMAVSGIHSLSHFGIRLEQV
jgi:SAM-dependent methyltransferase